MCMNNTILTKKDIIAINQKFAEGYFENESGLDYALSLLKHNISWTKKAAYLIRAILIDNSFVNGNKRSAYSVLMACVELNSYSIEEKKAVNIIKEIVTKNRKSVARIQRMIEDDITKK